MGLTREQFDIILNDYNNRRLKNKIESDRRFREVYEKVPAIQEYNNQISSLAVTAARKALAGDLSAKDSLREDIELISEKKKAMLLAHNFPADYLDEIFTCPICKDTGFIHGKPCTCLRDVIVSQLYSRSELQEILMRENFDTFDFDLYSDTLIDDDTGESALENIETVVDYCHYFINNFDKTFDNLLFYGKAGTGKTFLLNCIAKELIEKSYSVIYLSAIQLFDLLADYSFRRSNSSSVYRQISMDELLRCDLLIIDDLGTEMSNSFTDSSLFDCLNERLIHQKSTIISTNLSLDDLQKNYSERIFSRTTGNYKSFKIFGDDIRIKKKFTN
jgi:DNA replication protein DnaC